MGFRGPAYGLLERAFHFSPLNSRKISISACVWRGASPFWPSENAMTNRYARDSFAYGFDFTRPRSRYERVARLDALANLLDTAFILPGTNVRFGLDALIGLVPGIGDVISTLISLYIVHEARQLGAPSHVIIRPTSRSMGLSARSRSSVTPLM